MSASGYDRLTRHRHAGWQIRRIRRSVFVLVRRSGPTCSVFSLRPAVESEQGQKSEKLVDARTAYSALSF